MVKFANSPTQGKEEDEEAVGEMPSLSSSEEGLPNGSSKRKSDNEGHGSKKRKRKSKSEKGLKVNGSHSKRRHSVSKPARDPRDEASSPRPRKERVGTRSPTPVIDFDGLSKPSKLHI
jgi:GTP cyclohydrolase I